MEALSQAADTPLFRMRHVDPTDIPFIYNSALKSYRESPTVSGIPNTLYYEGQHRVLERLLTHSTVYVACNPEDPSQIFGYIVGTADTVHWVYVKHPLRKFGIAKALVTHLVGIDPTPPVSTRKVFYTHRVKYMDRYTKSFPHEFIYNPYLVHEATK